MTLHYHAIMDRLAQDADKLAVRFSMMSGVRGPSPAEYGVAQELYVVLGRARDLADELDTMQADVREPWCNHDAPVDPPYVCECGAFVPAEDETDWCEACGDLAPRHKWQDPELCLSRSD